MKKNPITIKYRKVLFLFLLLLSASEGFAQYEPNVLKAAYIERITRFIEWANTEGIDSIVFGIVNDREFEKTAHEIFKSQLIKELPVKVIHVSDENDLQMCHLCYVGNADENTINNFIGIANKKSILLLSNAGSYGLLGVHINFYIEGDKLKFEINKNSAHAAGFKISHLLMKSARII